MYFDCEIGGNFKECAVEIDTYGNAYVAGSTSSSDFPTVNVFDPIYHGLRDAFIMKIDLRWGSLHDASYLGGSAEECYESCSLSIDPTGAAYITGATKSSDFPMTVGSLQGGWDLFVAKVTPGGAYLQYAMVMGALWMIMVEVLL